MHIRTHMQSLFSFTYVCYSCSITIASCILDYLSVITFRNLSRARSFRVSLKWSHWWKHSYICGLKCLYFQNGFCRNLTLRWNLVCRTLTQDQDLRKGQKEASVCLHNLDASPTKAPSDPKGSSDGNTAHQSYSPSSRMSQTFVHSPDHYCIWPIWSLWP
jgi:hypothetical protein